jgi:protein TonB
MPRISLAVLSLAITLAAQDKPVVTPPTVIHKVEPKYTKRASKKKIEGTVTLKVVVGTDGRARNIEVVKSLDPDLDVNAIAAVKEWLFKPGTKDGVPVAVFANIEVNFRLL